MEVEDFEVLKGEGVKGKIDNKYISLLSKQALAERDIEIPEEAAIEDAATLIFIVINEKIAGAITLEDQIRDESYHAIKELQKSDIKCYMLTGDNEAIAKKVTEELGLDRYYAEILPHEKQDIIKDIQDKNEIVAMTGDGINDAPALAQADIGIAIGSGTDVAAETADIILVESNPRDVLSLIRFGRATYKKMVQNLFWATGYNVIAIPLAAGVLYSAGILISPAFGAALMSLSTVIVAVNAKFLSID
jgi:Cu2+-exporting ATPase